MDWEKDTDEVHAGDRHGRTETRTSPSGAHERTAGRRVRPPLTQMVRRVASDTGVLLRQELDLARLELKENATDFGTKMVQALVWIALAGVGGLALTACLILVIGLLLDGAYWAGALIVGVLFTAIGGLMARRAMKRLEGEDLKPDQTVDSLKEDRRWARHEADEFKRNLQES